MDVQGWPIGLKDFLISYLSYTAYFLSLSLSLSVSLSLSLSERMVVFFAVSYYWRQLVINLSCIAWVDWLMKRPMIYV
jgi:hypothetical protein